MCKQLREVCLKAVRRKRASRSCLRALSFSSRKVWIMILSEPSRLRDRALYYFPAPSASASSSPRRSRVESSELPSCELARGTGPLKEWAEINDFFAHRKKLKLRSPLFLMPVSLSNINKETNIYRFITSGKPGKCELCPARVKKLEAHHLCYYPEITLKLCHNCHHTVHFWPSRLTQHQLFLLLSKRFDRIKARKLLSENLLGAHALSALVAPSRSGFVKQRRLKH